jgi:DNA-binding beta-propeller fold protein YncE
LNKRFRGALTPLFLACAAVVAGCATSNKPILHDVGDLPLPGKPTRFEGQSFDPTNNRLYIAHSGDGELIMVDTNARKVIASLPNFPGCTGVLAVPEMQSVFVGVPGRDEVTMMNTGSLKVTRAAGGESPNFLAWASAIGKIYVSDRKDTKATVIDVRMNNRVSTIDLGGQMGAIQYDPRTGRILLTVRSTNELAEIDPATDVVASRLKLSGKTPHGLAIAPAARVAFAACADDAKLLVIDLEKWKVSEDLVTAEGPDMLAFDEGNGMLYVGTEANAVSVFQLKGKNLKRMGDIQIGHNAHSVCVNTTTHELYIPIENVNGKPTLHIMAPVMQ